MRVHRLIITLFAALGAALLPAGLILPISASAQTKGGKPSSGSCQSGNSGSSTGNSGGQGNGNQGNGDQGTGSTGGSGMSGGSGSGSDCPAGSSGSESGGASTGPPPPGTSTPDHPTVTGFTAKIINGVAYAPSYAPMAVKKAIWAGNKIRTKPYVWGGGHASFASAGYDCSGSVSYVLHAAGLLKTPEDSSEFESYGAQGTGSWITIYTNPGHAFIEIAGIRFDTSSEADPHPSSGSGPRWRPLYRNPSGFSARHPRSY